MQLLQVLVGNRSNLTESPTDLLGDSLVYCSVGITHFLAKVVKVGPEPFGNTKGRGNLISEVVQGSSQEPFILSMLPQAKPLTRIERSCKPSGRTIRIL